MLYIFRCVLCRLSSCDHLDLEKSPSARERNGKATGSRYIGKIKKRPVQQIFTPLCKPDLPLESGNKLDHFFPFFKISFLSIEVDSIRKGLPGGYDTMSSSVLMGDSRFHMAFSGFLSAPLGNHFAFPVKTVPLPPGHTARCTLT